MPNLTGRWKWLDRMLGKGVNSDVRPDAVPDGYARWQTNFRSSSSDGEFGSLETIGGTHEIYAPEEDGYVCIGAIKAGSDHFSVHAPYDVTKPVVCKVNGVIMVSSTLLPYQWDRPLQMVCPNSPDRAIVYPVDGHAQHLFFDLKAIKEAYEQGANTFTSGLNLAAMSVIPMGVEEHPEFEGLDNVGAGLPPGQYIYWLVYKYADGSVSAPGPETPPIAVPAVKAPIYWDGATYPGGQVTGGAPSDDEDTPTPYGIKLRFVIDNIAGATAVRIVRRRFNGGAGLDGPGVVEVVGEIPVDPGTYTEHFWTDPVDAIDLGSISVDEAERENVNITAAKAVEFVDRRLIYANVELERGEPEVEFEEVDGKKVVPVTTKVATKHHDEDYNDGYADARNDAYYKSARHNEAYDIGIMVRDSTGTKSRVVPVENNYVFPARRDRKEGLSLELSSDFIWAANSECQGDDPVSPTFDPIVQGKKRKTTNEYVNVVSGLNYNPWAPKGPDDLVNGSYPNPRWDMKPIVNRYVNGEWLPDIGEVFAPEVHSLGAAIVGPKNLDDAAPYWRVLTPMRSAPAGRVVDEGMGTYALTANGKHKDTVLVHFPDIESGVVSGNVLNDLEVNSSNYAAKLTPYGFYSEIYSYCVHDLVPGPVDFIRAFGADIISYCDVQFDDGRVNVGDHGTQGVQDPQGLAPNRNYVGYNAWRGVSPGINSDPQAPVFYDPSNVAQGAVEVPVQSIGREQEGRGVRYRVRFQRNVYAHGDMVWGADDDNFDTTTARNTHEPVYHVSLIRPGATTANLNIRQYISTGWHIYRERCIGIYPQGQFELFHARKGDAVPRQGERRYIYVQTNGTERMWMHGNNDLGGATITDVFDAIAANGFWVDPDGNEVYGVYASNTVHNNGDIERNYITFPYATVPDDGSRIVVKYDKREPIVFHGFDCTVAPHVWAAFDRTFNGANHPDSTDDSNNTHFRTRVPLPYSINQRSSNYLLPRDVTAPGSSEDWEPLTTGDVPNGIWSIRQWVIWGHVVSRTPQRMVYGNNRRNPFPRTHYRIRPTVIRSYESGQANGFNAQYDIDFPGEANYFAYGGFWVFPENNLDYAKQPLVTGFGFPANGIRRQRRLYTTFAASERWDPLAENIPGLRSFYADNLFTESDECGEIKYMAALDQSGSQQLWAWAEDGYLHIPYNAQTLTDADGNLIGTQSISTFWPRKGNWVARGSHGMPGDLWRLAAKVSSPTQDGSRDTVLWTDTTSVYMLRGGVAMDIATSKVRKEFLPHLSIPMQGNPRFTSAYNRRNNECWFSMPNIDGKGSRVLVYDLIRNEWVGEFTYDYEQYLTDGQRVVGFIGLAGYEVNDGDTIDKGPIECTVTVPFFPDPSRYKEAMRWRVVGATQDIDHVASPSMVEVYDENMNLLSVMTHMKNYDGYEGWVNRVLASVNPKRPLPQSNGFFLKVYYTTFGRKVLRQVGMVIKPIL